MQRRLILHFPHKMALPGVPPLSRGLVVLGHLLLLGGLLVPYVGPLLASPVAGLLFYVEHRRKTPYTPDAVRFGAQRAVLWVAVTAVAMAITLQTPTLDPQTAWSLVYVTAVPLAFYDLWLAGKGIPGAFYVSPHGGAR